MTTTSRLVSIALVAFACACGGLLDGDGRWIECPAEDPSALSCTHPADECPRSYTACGETRADTCVCTGDHVWTCPPREQSCSSDAAIDTQTTKDVSVDAHVDAADAADAPACSAEGATSCDVCVAQSCCALVVACDASPACATWKACVESCELGGVNAFACAESTCSGFHDQLEANVFACANESCSSACTAN